MSKKVVLFYKRLVALGGAEVLLSNHYQYLKSFGLKPIVVCFEYSTIDRLEIDQTDVIVIPGSNALKKIYGLAKVFLQFGEEVFFCHSGHIEFGIAANLTNANYHVFLHQPSSMSFNESDKFSIFYWRKYLSFAARNQMSNRLMARKAEMPLGRLAYINLRAVISQFILKRSSTLFVLSNYAVREKKEVFGLEAMCLTGGLHQWQITRLSNKEKILKKNLFCRRISLFTLSRLDENKRIDVLIRSFRLLLDRGLDVELIIGGTGPELEDLKQLASNLNLQDHISFLGFVPEDLVAAYLDHIDLFVTIDCADYRITTYEALVFGKKVVVSDDTECDRELIESGYLYCSSPKPSSLCKKIEEALKSDTRWDHQQLAAYLRKYSWESYFSTISCITGISCA